MEILGAAIVFIVVILAWLLGYYIGKAIGYNEGSKSAETIWIKAYDKQQAGWVTYCELLEEQHIRLMKRSDN